EQRALLIAAASPSAAVATQTALTQLDPAAAEQRALLVAAASPSAAAAVGTALTQLNPATAEQRALLIAAASPSVADPAAAARTALAQGELKEAERAALEALAKNPEDGGALLTLGLSRFKQGRPADALEALDRAAALPDVPEPGLIEYDRGSCLAALGRLEEAEQAFLRAAARDPALAPVAEVSAGLAALDAGAIERARAAADRAAAHPGPEGLAALVADLRAQISSAERRAADEAAARAGEQAEAAAGEGMTLFGAERYAEAERSFLRAAELDPSDGMHHLLAGASAYHLGHRSTAREQLEEALRLGLDPAESSAAREYLDGLSPGLRGKGAGLAARATMDIGVDTNALESGLGFPELQGPRRGPPGNGAGSPFASAVLGAAYRRGLGTALFGELTYTLDQVAYGSPLLAPDSRQQHALAATLELSIHPRVRLSLGAQSDVLFLGLREFHGIQWSAGAAAAAAVDEADWLTSRLKLEAGRKSALSSAYSEYTGGRIDATLAQDVRWSRALLTAWYRFREERIGTRQETELRPLPPALCTQLSCDQVTEQLQVIPFAYRSSQLAVTAAGIFPNRIRAATELGVEWRGYLADSYLRLTFADGSTLEADRRRRQDLRITSSLTAAFPLAGGFELGVRYDSSTAFSNVDSQIVEPACEAPDYSCHQLDYGSQSFQKQVLSISISYTR
ncbi:MAG TPA: tetratricopeptide repeat protein, partial [Myxococcales bacterium]|nr:tetratricopeptide repeat protein [Myxococcales bacterium]